MKQLDIDALFVENKVYWKDPANKTSGVYQILETNKEEFEQDGYEFAEDIYILIGNGHSEAEVYFQELYEIEG